MTTIKPGVVSVKLASGQVTKYVVFGGFADIVQDSCTLLAESAVPVTELNQDTLQKRIDATQAAIDNANSDEHKTKLEQFLSELTHLNGIVVPA
jgi:F-type H+-transporting ATPase subunit epsilon